MALRISLSVKSAIPVGMFARHKLIRSVGICPGGGDRLGKQTEHIKVFRHLPVVSFQLFG
jgi:hypothetical protein